MVFQDPAFLPVVSAFLLRYPCLETECHFFSSKDIHENPQQMEFSLPTEVSTRSIFWHHVYVASIADLNQLNQYFNSLNKQSIGKRKGRKKTNLSPPLRLLHGSVVITLMKIPPMLL